MGNEGDAGTGFIKAPFKKIYEVMHREKREKKGH